MAAPRQGVLKRGLKEAALFCSQMHFVLRTGPGIAVQLSATLPGDVPSCAVRQEENAMFVVARVKESSRTSS